ncbi:MAG: DsbA family oxidoreductase [Bacteroides sp.]|nr:DsbA family oxidoreductase [Bacteroides sp.]
MKIKIWSDFQCPFCYMGETRLEGVLGDMELTEPVEIVYKAYQLDPEAGDEPKETMTEHFMAGHDLTQEEAGKRMAKITAMAARVGLAYDLPGVKVCSSMGAHRLMKFAASRLSPGRLKKLNFHLFKANFEENLLLADHNVLADIAAGVGLAREEVLDMLSGDEYKADVMADQRELDSREDFEFVPYMLAGNGAVVQGVVTDHQLHDWIEGAMAGAGGGPSAKGDGCGPEGCAV